MNIGSRGGLMSDRGSRQLITSRLLVLQSKRLMLRSLERRLRRSNHHSIRERLGTLRADVEHANHAYLTGVLDYGSPADPAYWLVAYGRLIEKGNGLTAALRKAVAELPPAERYEASSDVEMLEFLIGGWNESLRRAMAEAVA